MCCVADYVHSARTEGVAKPTVRKHGAVEATTVSSHPVVPHTPQAAQRDTSTLARARMTTRPDAPTPIRAAGGSDSNLSGSNFPVTPSTPNGVMVPFSASNEASHVSDGSWDSREIEEKPLAAQFLPSPPTQPVCSTLFIQIAVSLKSF